MSSSGPLEKAHPYGTAITKSQSRPTKAKRREMGPSRPGKQSNPAAAAHRTTQLKFTYFKDHHWVWNRESAMLSEILNLLQVGSSPTMYNHKLLWVLWRRLQHLQQAQYSNTW